MSATTKPLIVVAGATSKQGRSVVSSLLRSERFRVRALTRDRRSALARRLARTGAELVTADTGSHGGTDLAEAFRGAEGAFLMTPPIAPPSTDELPLGLRLADAAAEAGVGHIVFSALENVHERSVGTKYAPHFTDKALIAEHIRTLPVDHTFIMLSFFYTNALEYYVPRVEGDTVLVPFYLPEDFPAPFVDPLTATGPAVLEIFSNPSAYLGASLPIVGDVVSPRDMVETFTRLTGTKARYHSTCTREELLAYFPHLGQNPLEVDEILGMAEYAVEFGYFDPSRDVHWSRGIDPRSLTWEQFLRTTGWRGDRVTFGG